LSFVHRLLLGTKKDTVSLEKGKQCLDFDELSP